MLTGYTETVYAQRSTHPECKGIHYTDVQDKRALECLINNSKKDSLIDNFSLQIFNLKSIVENVEEKSSSFEDHYIEEKELSEKLRKDLEKSKKWNKRILVGGPLVGLFVGILIMN